jgi:hypothetical protein
MLLAATAGIDVKEDRVGIAEFGKIAEARIIDPRIIAAAR